MKNKITYGIATVLMIGMCSMPLGTTAHASAARTSKVSTAFTTTKSWVDERNKEAKDKLTNKVNDIKEKIDTKVENDIANLVNLHLGDVGSVDVSTTDDVNVNISNSPVNVNVNINLININLGNRK